jgi:alkylmercury lyase
MSRRQRLLDMICSRRTPEEHAVSRAAFHAILSGCAIDPEGLESSTGLDPETVSAVLSKLAARGLVVLEPGSNEIVGSWGLSLAPTNHRLCIRGRELYAWCAIDAVGIPAGLEEDGAVTSECHECGKPVRIKMVAGQVSSVEPAGVHVWVTPSQPARSVVGDT